MCTAPSGLCFALTRDLAIEFRQSDLEQMHSFSRIGMGGWNGLPSFPSSRIARSVRAAAGAAASASYMQRVSGIQGVSKAAWTSGVLSALGDTLAQALGAYYDKQQGKTGTYDPWRTARMFGFGFLWYGPYQYYWYNALEFLMPTRSLGNFLIKVASNQLLLAPATLTAVFSWNLICQGKEKEIPGKLMNDLLPTMMNGWKFWIPAASLNFWIVPLNMQVAYMSCCGILWTAYLSYASTVQVSHKKPLLVSCVKR